MKKNSLLSISLALLLVFSFALSGCAGTAKPTPQATPTPEIKTPAPTPTPTPEINTPAPIEEPAYPETLTFKAEDSIKITADLYKTENESAPYIILFHMGDSSRGEYIEIAPRLNEMGYNCLAVDTRQGSSMNDITNETSLEAVSKYTGVYDYNEAWPDVKAALSYVKEELKAEKIIIWGSSYTSSLGLVLGSEFAEDISAILAFSPGEYFKLDGKEVGDYAANVKCPVFITAESVSEWPESPYDYADMAKTLYEKIPSEDKVFFMPDSIDGKHGSGILFSAYADSELYWDQVIDFLNNL